MIYFPGCHHQSRPSTARRPRFPGPRPASLPTSLRSSPPTTHLLNRPTCSSVSGERSNTGCLLCSGQANPSADCQGTMNTQAGSWSLLQRPSALAHASSMQHARGQRGARGHPSMVRLHRPLALGVGDIDSRSPPWRPYTVQTLTISPLIGLVLPPTRRARSIADLTCVLPVGLLGSASHACEGAHHTCT